MKQGRKPANLAGKRFGKVVALERVGTWISPKAALWSCLCDCGEVVVVASHRLKELRAPSCQACAPQTGQSKDSAYGVWNGMVARCERPGTNGYYLYGGRGVRVCKRWRESFLDFLADVGPRPSSNHWLGRIDHDGHYEPGNVRWETREEQLINRRPHNCARFVEVRPMGAE